MGKARKTSGRLIRNARDEKDDYDYEYEYD